MRYKKASYWIRHHKNKSYGVKHKKVSSSLWRSSVYAGLKKLSPFSNRCNSLLSIGVYIAIYAFTLSRPTAIWASDMTWRRNFVDFWWKEQFLMASSSTASEYGYWFSITSDMLQRLQESHFSAKSKYCYWHKRLFNGLIYNL